MIQGNDYSHAHLLSAGIKIFTRQDSRTNPADTYCKWRIPSDGLSTMLPYLDPGAMLHADVDDLRMLLEEQYPIVSTGKGVHAVLGDLMFGLRNDFDMATVDHGE
jgi:multisite-specific tRNA:(cytosine-C5)-methyltransferase